MDYQKLIGMDNKEDFVQYMKSEGSRRRLLGLDDRDLEFKISELSTLRIRELTVKYYRFDYRAKDETYLYIPDYIVRCGIEMLHNQLKIRSIGNQKQKEISLEIMGDTPRNVNIDFEVTGSANIPIYTDYTEHRVEINVKGNKETFNTVQITSAFKARTSLGIHAELSNALILGVGYKVNNKELNFRFREALADSVYKRYCGISDIDTEGNNHLSVFYRTVKDEIGNLRKIIRGSTIKRVSVDSSWLLHVECEGEIGYKVDNIENEALKGKLINLLYEIANLPSNKI